MSDLLITGLMNDVLRLTSEIATLRGMMEDREEVLPVVDVKAVPVPAAAPALPLPWAPIGADVYGNVSFVPGLASGYMPKIGATALNNDPPPTLEITTTGTVYLEMDLVDDQIDASSALIKNAAATPADTTEKAFVTIHYVRRTELEGVVTLAWAIGRFTSIDIWRCDGLTRVRRA